MSKNRIFAPQANATTYLTIIDVQVNVIKLCFPAMQELAGRNYNADRLEAALQPFIDELQKQNADSDYFSRQPSGPGREHN